MPLMLEESHTAFSEMVLQERLVLVVSPSEVSFNLIERTLGRISDAELRWHSDTIEALADIFMSHPHLLVVFGDSNHETLEFIQLVRNNSDFQALTVYAVLPEPLKFRQRFTKHLKIAEVFSTPIDTARLYSQAMAVLFPEPSKTPNQSKTDDT